jgi:hypothetical protein
MRHTVVMKVSDREAHICMGENEVQVGDRVKLYRVRCLGKAGDVRGCPREEIGEGVVVKRLNAHYSVVRVPPGVPFEEGTRVEKR